MAGFQSYLAARLRLSAIVNLVGHPLNMRFLYAVGCACILFSTVKSARISKTSTTVSWFGEHAVSSLATVMSIRGGAGEFLLNIPPSVTLRYITVQLVSIEYR